jgi:hypothetical protein
VKQSANAASICDEQPIAGDVESVLVGEELIEG